MFHVYLKIYLKKYICIYSVCSVPLYKLINSLLKYFLSYSLFLFVCLTRLSDRDLLKLHTMILDLSIPTCNCIFLHFAVFVLLLGS